MRRLLPLFAGLLMSGMLSAQSYPLVTIQQINQVIDLQACNDSSIYLGDTVRFRAHVVTDGGLSEVASGSVQGGNRPFIYMMDTAANGVVDSLNGIEVMGIYTDAQGNLQPIPGFTALFQGDKVEVTAVVEEYQNNTQLTTIDVNSVTLLSSGDLLPSAFIPKVVPVSDLNDNQRVNNVQAGEYWQNSFVDLQNVTVVQVIPFSGNRVSFNVADANGNVVNVSDRFLAQRTPSHTTVNPNTPSASGTGSFVAPSVGTFYTSLKGIIRHSGNGCTGGTGRGYEINPFDSSHYEIGASAPSIANVFSFPVVPSSSDSVLISADIADADGTIDSVQLFWSANTAIGSGSFGSVNMSLSSGTTYEYYVPAQADGSLVRYWIRAVDNDGSAVVFPASPAGFSDPYFNHYTVRDNGLRIFDIQYSGNGTGSSVFEGQQVTVRGFITSARRDCDLEYVHLQDPNDTIYAGITLIPNQDLDNVYRDQEIQVTGTVQETFGVTYLNVDNYVGLGNSQTIMPTPIDPSDPNLNKEMYEGMLISYQNPNGGKIFVSNPNNGFGEYSLATDASFGSSQSSRVLAGRQSGTSATSSLYVSLISDSLYVTSGGNLMVPAIIADGTMDMDAMHGILWYSFGNYKLLPRNNFDIINLSTPVDTSGCNVPTNIAINEIAAAELAIYPNPANASFTIESANASVAYRLMDLNGRVILSSADDAFMHHVNVSNLTAGVYILHTTETKTGLSSSHKVVVGH